ncbi:MAG: pyridoxal phosphate-dependent aminotransferase [Burkholderiaceae bacterium]
MPSYPFSRRCDAIEPFQVMELAKRAGQLQAAGHPVIHMSIGEPDFTAPPQVVRALERAAAAGHSRYTAANGIAPLRRAIAAYYQQEYGLAIDPARVIVTAGASAALLLAFCALVDPGDQVLMADPGYPCNRHFVAAFDARATPVPVGPQTRFQLSRELIERHWGERIKGTLIASPANPTGTAIPFDELAGIVEAVRRRRGFVVVDEIYLGLSYPAPGQGPVRSALALGDDVIVCNSFSKFFNMTGWRLGWLVVPPDAVPVFEKLSQNLFICASALAQHAALACFEPDTMALLAERRESFRQRRDYLVPALESIGLHVPVMPDGAFYVYADCGALGLDSSRFAHDLLETEYVSLVPGTDFGKNAPDRYLRLSYATSRTLLEQAVERMGRFLEKNRPA